MVWVQFFPAHEAKATLAEHFLEMLFCTHRVVLGTQIRIIFYFFFLGAKGVFGFTLTGMGNNVVLKGLYDGCPKTFQMLGLIRPSLPCSELLVCIKPFPSGLVGESRLLQLYLSERLSQLEPLVQRIVLAGNHLEMQISLGVWLGCCFHGIC